MQNRAMQQVDVLQQQDGRRVVHSVLQQRGQQLVGHLLRRELQHIDRQHQLRCNSHDQGALPAAWHSMQQVPAAIWNAPLGIPQLRGKKLPHVLKQRLGLVQARVWAPRQDDRGYGTAGLLPVLVLRVQPVKAMVLAVVVHLNNCKVFFSASSLDLAAGFDNILQKLFVASEEGHGHAGQPPIATLRAIAPRDPDPLRTAPLRSTM
mmetsp:Transcript_16688/g.48438  ORF Transcript_16688/g.48438 Transcript_16688/m.48438 type:complete len:206 (+) Transcript_16688:457-1074(+)